MPPFRAVLVGCGPRGEGHANAYALADDVDLVGCCDLDAARAADFAERFGIATFGDNLDEVLAACRPDLVDVCTPASVRLPVVTAALAAQPSALLVEKPLSWLPEEARQLAAAAEAADVRLFVNHQLRFLPPVVELRDLIASGAIGDVRSIRATTQWSLLEQGTHLFDLVSFLLGDRVEFHRVVAQAVGWEPNAALPPAPFYTQGVVLADGDRRVYFECGPQAPTWPGRDQPWHQAGIELTGSNGHATWSLNRGWTCVSGDRRWENLYLHDDLDDRTEARLLDDLVAATRTGAAHQADVAIALRSFDVVMAAERSALRRQWVELPARCVDADVRQLRDLLAVAGPGQADGLLERDEHARRLRRLSDVAPNRTLYALSVLGVANHLLDGPRTTTELARLTGAHQETLFRLLRAATALDVLSAEDADRWSLRPAGRLLSDAEPENLRAQFSDNDLFVCWSGFADTLYNGESSYTKAFGQSFFARLSEHPDGMDNFHTHMFERAHALYKSLIDLDVWPATGSCVDVCGGTGGLLAQLLANRPGLRGVLHDLPEVLEISPLRRRAELADRVVFVATDVFTEVPAGHDVYVVASVLHDWDDQAAIEILGTCRRAMSAGSRLFVIERVLAWPGEDTTIFSDLWMLVVAGGRERTGQEWRTLLAAAGFDLVAVHEPVNAELGLLECVATEVHQ
ncbi:methyltransferase [Actinophytocola sediminis]